MGFISRLASPLQLVQAQEHLAESFELDTPHLSPWADGGYLEQITSEDILGVPPSFGSRKNAMRIAAVAKARNLICTTIARMSIRAMKGHQPANRQPTWFKQIQPGVSNFHVLSWVADHLFFYGRAWLVIKDRDARGQILATQFVPFSKAEEQDGQLVRAFGHRVAAADTIRIDANNEGFLSYARDVILEAWEIDQAAREAGANPVPTIVLKHKEGTAPTEEAIDGLLDRWASKRRKRYGSVGYVSKGLDVQAIGQNSENLLIDARNYSVLQIARASGLPAWALDGAVKGANLNYQNQASRNREIIDAVSPIMLAIEAVFTLFLPSGQDARFDAAEMLRDDTARRYETYATGIQAGFLTINEVREREKLAALPEPAPAADAAPKPSRDEDAPA